MAEKVLQVKEASNGTKQSVTGTTFTDLTSMSITMTCSLNSRLLVFFSACDCSTKS